MKAPLPDNETARLKALNECKILDTEPESTFNDITQLAASICGTPIAMVQVEGGAGDDTIPRCLLLVPFCNQLFLPEEVEVG